MSHQSRISEPAAAVSGIVRPPMPLDELDPGCARHASASPVDGISMLGALLSAIVVWPPIYEPLTWLRPLIGVSEDTINDATTLSETTQRFTPIFAHDATRRRRPPVPRLPCGHPA